MVQSVGNQQNVSLQQFITDNPGAEGLAQVLKTKGMGDDEIVQLLQKSKEQWIGRDFPDIAAGGDIKITSLRMDSESQTMSDIYAFMAVFMKMAQQMRNTNRELRQSEMQAEQSKLAAAANEIREAAKERFTGAVVAGAMQIGAGALQVGAGAYSLGKMASAQSSSSKIMTDAKAQSANNDMMFKEAMKSNAGKEGFDVGGARDKFATQQKDVMDRATAQSDKIVNAASARATNVGAMGTGGGQMLQGVGQIVQASQELKASEHDAHKAELEAQAKVHDQAQQQAGEIMQQMQDIIRDIRDKLSSIEQSRIETNRGISRNI